MPRAETRLTDDEKKAWRDFCQDRSVSESDMLRLMIKQVSGGEGEAGTPDQEEKKIEQISIRISSKDKYRLIKRAMKEGYPNRTSWVTSLVLSALHREPVLNQDEITALRESNRQLAAIGRNLNQMVRTLNTDARAQMRITRAEVKDLAGLIEDHKTKVAELLNQNLNRWGMDDE